VNWPEENPPDVSEIDAELRREEVEKAAPLSPKVPTDGKPDAEKKTHVS